MGPTLPRDNRQDKILSLIDDLFDVGRALAKELAITRFERQANDQAETPIAPAQGAQPSQSASTPEPYLTIEQIAQILGEKVDTVYAKVGRGQIPHHKLDLGRKSDLRFRYSEIVAWSKANADRIQEQKRSPKRKLRVAS